MTVLLGSDDTSAGFSGASPERSGLASFEVRSVCRSPGATHSTKTMSAAVLKPSGIHYLDVGTSGGVWGLERGYCLMIGGDEATARHTRTRSGKHPEDTWP